MKASLLTVVLVAVASSLVTVGAIEVLRGSDSRSQPAFTTAPAPESPAAPAPREVEALDPVTRLPDQVTDLMDRLAELERRIAALEISRSSERTPVTSEADELPAQEELRQLVLAWVAEERETRARDAELEEEENRRREREFEARFNARTIAQEHDLPQWQEDGLVQVFLEMQERRREIDESIDRLEDDPEEVQARLVEFNEWTQQRLLEELGQELYEQIFGEG